MGHEGNDTLDGGPGSDAYSYSTLNFGADQLKDEGPATDKDTLAT